MCIIVDYSLFIYTNLANNSILSLSKDRTHVPNTTDINTILALGPFYALEATYLPICFFSSGAVWSDQIWLTNHGVACVSGSQYMGQEEFYGEQYGHTPSSSEPINQQYYPDGNHMDPHTQSSKQFIHLPKSHLLLLPRLLFLFTSFFFLFLLLHIFTLICSSLFFWFWMYFVSEQTFSLFAFGVPKFQILYLFILILHVFDCASVLGNELMLEQCIWKWHHDNWTNHYNGQWSITVYVRALLSAY